MRVVADVQPHRGHEGLERGVRRRDPDLPLPLRIGQAEDRVRHLVLGQLVGVVDDHAGPAGRADPAAVVVAEALVDRLEHVVRQLRELLVDRAERARVLREEDVGGRVVALLRDRRRELGAVAVADLDLDARLLLEPLEERLDELLLAAGIDDERVLVAAAPAATRQRQCAAAREQNDQPSSFTSPVSGTP